jgi:predicted nuclease of predicted toxin-antitoxin system
MLESGEATDQSIWKVAKSDGYLIVSKDTDFNDLAILRGPPPKVINIALGNCTTQQVESHLRMKARAILEFEQNPGDGLLILP